MTLRIWIALFVDPSPLTISSGLMDVNVTAKKILYDLLVDYQSIVDMVVSISCADNIRHSLSAEAQMSRKNGAKQLGTDHIV